jgi:hypothetical protein
MYRFLLDGMYFEVERREESEISQEVSGKGKKVL